jgi:prefoldin subunit 5
LISKLIQHLLTEALPALEKSLDNLSSAAADAARAANNLSASEQQASKSAQQLAQQQTKAGNAASKSTSQFNGLATAAKGLGAIFAARQILEWGTAFVTVADNINLLQSRINLYTKSQQETNQVFGQLQEISNRAGVSLRKQRRRSHNLQRLVKIWGSATSRCYNWCKTFRRWLAFLVQVVRGQRGYLSA